MLGSIVLTLALTHAAGAPGERIYEVTSTGDRAELAKFLRRYVAHITAEVAREDSVLSEPARTGYAVPWTDHLLAVLCFTVEDAKRIRVQGPDGSLFAKIILYDAERRVALLETTDPLSKIGLVPVSRVKTSELKVEQPVFALVSTLEEAGVVDGVITDLGEEPELEGHPRTDLLLTHGMPVFDDRARFIGYARAVAWDRDRQMLVPPDKISAAQAATHARDAKKTSSERPWWGR